MLVYASDINPKKTLVKFVLPSKGNTTAEMQSETPTAEKILEASTAGAENPDTLIQSVVQDITKGREGCFDC